MHVLVLIGSTKQNASNQKLVSWLAQETARQQKNISWEIFPIATLPYFNPDLAVAPEAIDKTDTATEHTGSPFRIVTKFRTAIAMADGLLICTPEYIFSLPGILKNALEWLVATTALTDKPVALITAAASGEKAKESLELIIKTLGGRFTAESSIRIQGIAGKFNQEGMLTDQPTVQQLQQLLDHWTGMITQP